MKFIRSLKGTAMKRIPILTLLMALAAGVAWGQPVPNAYQPTGPLVGGAGITITPNVAGTYTISSQNGTAAVNIPLGFVGPVLAGSVVPYICTDQIELPAGLVATTPAGATAATQVTDLTDPTISDSYILSNVTQALTIDTINTSTTASTGGKATYSTTSFCSTGSCIACKPGDQLTLTAPGTVRGEADILFNFRGTSP